MGEQTTAALHPVRPSAYYPRFLDTEYERRTRELRDAMRAQKLEALIIWGNSSGWGEAAERTGMAGVFYLSNFADQLRAAVLLTLDGPPLLYTFSTSHRQSALCMAVVPVLYDEMRLMRSIGRKLRESGLEQGRIGVVGPLSILGLGLPLEQEQDLRSALPEAQLIPAGPLFDAVRRRKSQVELSRLRRAATLTDLAMGRLAAVALPGVSEHSLHQEVASSYLPAGGHLHYQCLGATSMSTPVLSGPARLRSGRRLAQNDVINAEISVGWWGYSGFLVRPVAVGGPPTPAYQACFDAAADAYQQLLRTLRPSGSGAGSRSKGMNSAVGSVTDAVAQVAKLLDNQGYHLQGIVVRGWGVGLEPPVITWPHDGAGSNPTDIQTVQADTTLAVCVNAVQKGTRIGVAVGDLVRITPSGAVPLQTYPLSFIEAGEHTP